MEENILEKIYNSGLKLLEPLSADDTYQTIVKEAIKLVNGSYGSLTLLTTDGDFQDVYTTLPINVKRRKKGFTYKAFKEKKAYVLHNQKTDYHKSRYPEMAEIGIKSIILIPLSYRKKSMGVLIVNSIKDQQFTKRELDILQLFGSLASLAIRKTQLYDDAKAALDLRDSFISMASHELRTPLTSINGYIQLLQTRINGEDTSEARWINHLALESNRLTNLVKELLEVNRIKKGEFYYLWKECSLKTIIGRALENTNQSFPDRLIMLEDSLKHNQDLVVGDTEKLFQVFLNLFENSVHYSKFNQKITISLRELGKFFSVKVTDRGKGISKKDLPFIFERYYRGVDNSKEGMGVGLYLVKDIVSRHHGLVNVKSKEGRGTTIEVKLPKAKI